MFLVFAIVDWEAEKEQYNDDEDNHDVSGSGDGTSRNVLNIDDVFHGETFVSGDHTHHNRGRIKHSHQTKRPESSSGGLGILWSLVAFAFVFSVVAVMFLRR